MVVEVKSEFMIGGFGGRISKISESLISEYFVIYEKNYEISIKINVCHIFIVDKHILRWYFFCRLKEGRGAIWITLRKYRMLW